MSRAAHVLVTGPARHTTTARTYKVTRIHALQLLGLAGLGTLLVGAVTPVQAQDAGGFYGGLSIGQARVKIDEPRITAGLLGLGLTTTAMTRD